MSPRKQPHSLFKISVRNSMNLINRAIYIIEKKYPENKCNERVSEALSLKSYLISLLPARIFDVLCSERACQFLNSDRPNVKNQILVLTHPKMAVFRKSKLDNSIPLQFWLTLMPNFRDLIILDLKFICSDEILEVIGLHCLRLEEINIVSRVDILRSDFNASVLIRNVSDVGLKSVANLKKLCVLAMDPPRSEQYSKRGRCVSQTGIIQVVSSLPCLQELKIDTCDIGSTLINAQNPIGPLSLRKINYHFAAAAGIRKLAQICPNLTDLSVTQLSENTDVIDEISASELKLNRLDLSFFSFTSSIQQLLNIKGCYLTNFCLWDDKSVSFDALYCIGQCCPHLNTLFLMTMSRDMIIPEGFKKPHHMFSQLQKLTIGMDGFLNIEQLLSFFLEGMNKMDRLVVKSQTKTMFDSILLNLLQKGCFRNIKSLWLDCTFEVSVDAVKTMINLCDNLKELTVDLHGTSRVEIHKYISDNNLDFRLGGY